LRPSNDAVMVVDPGPRLVARPVASIVATVGSLLVHVALMSTTELGAGVSIVVPLPSSPYVFIPQHFTKPPRRTTQLSLLPAATAPVAVVVPLTIAGANLLVVVPSPICPSLLYPQHRAVPSWRTAQLWMTPAATPTAVLIALTRTGV